MIRLDLVVGPNGAGKSTYVRFVLAPKRRGVPFVNADVLAAQRWPDPDEAMLHAVEVFDNSGEGPRTVALFIAGQQVGRARWPPWAPDALTELTD